MIQLYKVKTENKLTEQTIYRYLIVYEGKVIANTALEIDNDDYALTKLIHFLKMNHNKNWVYLKDIPLKDLEYDVKDLDDLTLKKANEFVRLQKIEGDFK